MCRGCMLLLCNMVSFCLGSVDKHLHKHTRTAEQFGLQALFYMGILSTFMCFSSTFIGRVYIFRHHKVYRIFVAVLYLGTDTIFGGHLL